MHTSLAVIGGGSAGVAAAWAAARMGVPTVLVERDAGLGGTAIQAGVHCWEPGTGGTGIPFDLYRRLRATQPDGVGITSFGRHFCWQDGWYWPDQLDKVNFPGGEQVIDPARGYLDTLRRHPGPGKSADEAFIRRHWHGVMFEPEAMEATMRAILRECGVTLCHATPVREVLARDGAVQAAMLDDGGTLTADYWIDASGGHFCRLCGCAARWGRDARASFHEPDAPEQSSDAVNGVSLLYRITPATTPGVEPLPADIPDTCWWAPAFPPMANYVYPRGDRYCNPLPIMDGREWLRLGEDAADAECRRRVPAHWHFVQTHFPEFQSYRLASMAPRLGIREGWRVVCAETLTERDLLDGLPGQHAPDIIAVADHALDRHGEDGGCRELAAPYGIPYRCLLPQGWNNLLVAGRAAGFSSLAASSCRLTRTMMQLGQAAGTAVALAAAGKTALPTLAPDALRAALHAQHVQLSWPIGAELRKHLSAE